MELFYTNRHAYDNYIYFIGEQPDKHDVARTVSNETVKVVNALVHGLAFPVGALALWTLSPAAIWFAGSHLPSDGSTPPGVFGVVLVVMMVLGILGACLAVFATIVLTIEGELKDLLQESIYDLKSIRGTNLGSQRSRCVRISYSFGSHCLHKGPASVKALLGALHRCSIENQVMDSLYAQSDFGRTIKPLVDTYLTATIKTDHLLELDSLSEEVRAQLQGALDQLAGQYADEIAAIFRETDSQAERERQAIVDDSEVQAIQATVELAEATKVRAMLALSDMQVAGILPQKTSL